MYVATCSECRELDRIAWLDFGLPGLVLMENASRSILAQALDFWPFLAQKGRRIAILAGPGQNGGDGWVLARLFSNLNHLTDSFLITDNGRRPQGDAAVNFSLLKKLGLNLKIIESPTDPLPDFSRYSLIVDAIFGAGLDRPLSGAAARTLASACQAERSFKVLAVDLPSGLYGDSGECSPETLRADLTVTLGAYKPGFFLKKGPLVTGAIKFGDIGLCPQMYQKAEPKGRVLDLALASSLVPIRPQGGHKGTFGHAVLLGGSKGKNGALVLAALGAHRSGCGLVTAAHASSQETIF
ncbi:MAG: NAD(P)H-hydrate epimerase, partial [Deltaproteobacteria bacterium]|nr:NAD(P)H-hydrate epimerase [Deltaproteobacteria bacterium]